MARKLQEILDGVKLTGADSDQLAKTLTTQAATPRTEEQLRAEAERAVGSLYSEKQLAAQQRYDREQGALRSQLDALGTSYQRQTEQAEKNTRLALSGADQRALSRGMGRSSYNLATLGNIQSEGNRTLDYIQQNRTNQEGAINQQLTQQSQQLADLLAEYKTNRETDIMARMDQLRATDKQDARAATEYNNNLIMALADRLSQERERERLAGLQEREMGLKESSTAFSQDMAKQQFDWTKSAQERELTLKEKANAFDEMMRSDQFAWTKGIQEREMTLKEKAEAYDQMAAEREYKRRYGNTGAGYVGEYTSSPGRTPPPKDVPLNNGTLAMGLVNLYTNKNAIDKVGQALASGDSSATIKAWNELPFVNKAANNNLANSAVLRPQAEVLRTMELLKNPVAPPNPIRYTDGYSAGGNKTPSLLLRLNQLEK